MSADESKIDSKVSTEELNSAKAEIAEDLEDEAVDSKDFEVTKEEMSIIRAELACEFPDDYEYLRCVYMLCGALRSLLSA
eukprot:scaffold17061_cov77-Cyclotella_meneghiniana.AAC.1